MNTNEEKELTIDALANEIRRVDGGNTLGAGALAEAIMPFIRAALRAESEPVGYIYYGITITGEQHGPHFVRKPEHMDAYSAEKGVKAQPLYTAHQTEQLECPTCKSKGFDRSKLGADRCTFCDGTEGGNPPEE